MRSIGIDIGKKKCVICIMDASGKILEETSYDNTKKDAERFAKHMKKKYRRCQAACESTGTMWQYHHFKANCPEISTFSSIVQGR